MTLDQRIELLVLLGKYLLQDTDEKELAILRTEQYNRWLTKENSKKSLDNIAIEFLTEEKLTALVSEYNISTVNNTPKKVGLILAGNIPAVGFHDVLCTFLSGNIALIKYSEKDKFLIPLMIDYMAELEPKVRDLLQEVNRLKGFDAVIATGSNNSALHFEQYFGKYQHIIRKNRNSVAILDGTETKEELMDLGQDIFDYYGLGCRSVSKLYLPKDYDLPNLLGVLDSFEWAMDHNKYKNNYDYNRSIYLLNRMPHLANYCVMILENESLLSRIAALHYEYYTDAADLENKLKEKKEEIQCIASNKKQFSFIPTVGLGQTQCPTIHDYADGVDTLDFLIAL